VPFEIDILEPKQGRQLFLAKLLDTDIHVMREHEIKENLLLGVQVRTGDPFRLGRPFFTAQRRERIGNMRQHVEQIALFRIDDLLHLGQLFPAKAFLGESRQ
jgi:hypothetical protein